MRRLAFTTLFLSALAVSCFGQQWEFGGIGGAGWFRTGGASVGLRSQMVTEPGPTGPKPRLAGRGSANGGSLSRPERGLLVADDRAIPQCDATGLR